MASVSRPPRTTPPVRVSYPTVFTPRAVQAGQTPKYSIVLMFDKNDKEHMGFLKEVYGDLNAVLAEAWPDPVIRPRIPVMGHTDSPIKDGDKNTNRQGVPLAEKNPEYAGHYIVRASTTNRPVAVDRGMAEIMDQAEIYGGCYCKVNLNVYSYNTAGNKGVTFGLNGVQKWADGESFGGGRPPADEMFEAAAQGADDPANYGPDPFATGAAQAQQANTDPFAGTPNYDSDIPF